MLALLPAERALAGGLVTIDLDTTDAEVYGVKKRGVAYNYQARATASHHRQSSARAVIRICYAVSRQCVILTIGGPGDLTYSFFYPLSTFG